MLLQITDPVPILQIHSPTTIYRPENHHNRNALRYRCCLYGRRVRAGRTLHKDAAAISRPAYPVAGDNAIIARERNPSALTNVLDDTPMTRPDLALLGDKDRPNWWPCSGHRPPNIIPFDEPVLTAGGIDSPPPALENRAVRYSPVVAAARHGRKADRWSIVPHVKC